MKRGRNLTKQESIHVASFRLKPANWMMSKKMAGEWLIVNRSSGNTRTIPAP